MFIGLAFMVFRFRNIRDARSAVAEYLPEYIASKLRQYGVAEQILFLQYFCQ